MFNYSLTDEEVLKLYTLQSEIVVKVRSCNDVACSGETFVGPQNTFQSNFTDTFNLLNTTLTPDNQYFQYNVSFLSNSINLR